jgi:hypothetical protein
VNTSSPSTNAAKGAPFFPAPPGGGAAFGSHSLALNIDGTGLSSGLAGISLDFCPGGALATGIQGALHVSVWFKPTDGNGAPGGPGFTYLNDGNGGFVGGDDTTCPAGVWFDVPSHTLSVASVKHVDVTIGGLENHVGVLYFDNIYFD